MSTGYSLSQLVLVVFLVFCFAAGDSSATRHGFFYTRNRGRCTPQYWSSRVEAWPSMVPQRSTVSRVFGTTAGERYGPDLTLMESTAVNDEEGNAYGALAKQGIAALLNAYSRRGFPYTPWQVKTLLIQAMVSEAAAARQARRFFDANHACDLAPNY